MKIKIIKGFGYLIMLGIMLLPLVAVSELEQAITESADEVPLTKSVGEIQFNEENKKVNTTEELLAIADKQEVLTDEKQEIEDRTKRQNKKAVKSSNKKKISVKKSKSYENKEVYQAYAKSLFTNYGWTEEDYKALIKLVNKESSWNTNAVNKSSGACGLFQALPCSKMASEGSDYRTNYKTQIKWGLKYIKNRYGSPSKAWNFWKKKGWY